jgi:hypothetical protein
MRKYQLLGIILALTVCLGGVALARAQTYSFQPLPILAGASIDACQANAITPVSSSVSSTEPLVVGDCFNFIEPVGVYWNTSLNVEILAPSDYALGWEIQPVAINGHGQIAGFFQTAFNAAIQGFFMSSAAQAAITEIPLLPGYSECYVNGMNSSGVVVGYCTNEPGGTIGEAFSWTKASGLVAIQGLANCENSSALSITDGGEIFGVSDVCGGKQITEFWEMPSAGSASQIVDSCEASADNVLFETLFLGPGNFIGGTCGTRAFIDSPQGVLQYLFPANDPDLTQVLGWGAGSSNPVVALGNDAGSPFIAVDIGGTWTVEYLNTLLGFGAKSQYFLNNAISINGPGQIVGQAGDAENETFPAYFLTPVPSD